MLRRYRNLHKLKWMEKNYKTIMVTIKNSNKKSCLMLCRYKMLPPEFPSQRGTSLLGGKTALFENYFHAAQFMLSIRKVWKQVICAYLRILFTSTPSTFHLFSFFPFFSLSFSFLISLSSRLPSFIPSASDYEFLDTIQICIYSRHCCLVRFITQN